MRPVNKDFGRVMIVAGPDAKHQLLATMKRCDRGNISEFCRALFIRLGTQSQKAGHFTMDRVFILSTEAEQLLIRENLL